MKLHRAFAFVALTSTIGLLGCQVAGPIDASDPPRSDAGSSTLPPDAASPFDASLFDASFPGDASIPGDAAIPIDATVVHDAAPPGDASPLVWRRANLTNFTSYPDPGSDECVVYNGCTWAGYFAALDDQQTEAWVASHDIVAVHSRDFATYELKTLRLRQNGVEMDVVVYDMCADSDCSGCCTDNAQQNGLDFLIDIERYTMARFGSGDGIVEWACLDC